MVVAILFTAFVAFFLCRWSQPRSRSAYRSCVALEATSNSCVFSLLTNVSTVYLKSAKMRNIAVEVILLSGAGLAGWYGGRWSERKRLSTAHPVLPGVPLFGTVSAAAPITPKEITVVDENTTNMPVPKSRVSQIMRFGFPGLDNVRSFDDFILSYDRRNRVAHWVFEHLKRESVKHNDAIDRSKCEFKEDDSIHKFFRSTNKDYKGSGYDRGHLAAAGNHRSSQTYVDQTFFLSNIAPQVGVGFNRNSWNRLEKHVRRLTKIYKNVYVCTGPLYLPRKEDDGKTYVKYEVIGPNTVAVPTHFFKVVVGETKDEQLEMEAYVMPNQQIDDNTPLSVFQVPPESIERAAGLLFFDRISRNKLRLINGKKTSYV